MPNRIIKESIRTDKALSDISDFAFRLWVNLITYADDYGIGPADPDVLKGFLFSRVKSATESKIKAAVNELVKEGLILVYEVDGEAYFWFPKWAKHQRIQTKRSKYPSPPETEINFPRWVTVKNGIYPLESNPIQSESKSKSESNPNICSEPLATVEAVILNDGSEWKPTATAYQEYERLYPSVDLKAEFAKMRSWCMGNPTKRKTSKGVSRFVTGWLSRAQDSGRAIPRAQEQNIIDRWRNA